MKPGGCAAVREVFVSHCGGGREGGKEIFIWQWCGRHKWWFVCIYVGSTTFVIVFMLFLLYCCIKTQRWQVKNKVCCGGMICFLNKHELQLNDWSPLFTLVKYEVVVFFIFFTHWGFVWAALNSAVHTLCPHQHLGGWNLHWKSVLSSCLWLAFRD